VDINTIRARLGHASLATSNVYAEVDLEMKAKALETCEIKGDGGRKACGRRLAALVGRYSEAMGVAVIVSDKELGLSVVAIHNLRN
jgi:hypothetical protein